MLASSIEKQLVEKDKFFRVVVEQMAQYLSGWKVPASKLTEICLWMAGINLKTPSKGWIVLTVKVALILTSLVQAVTSLCIHWADKKEVFRVVNDVNAIVYGTCLVITFSLYHGRIVQLLTMLQQGLFQYSTPMSRTQQSAKRDAARRIEIAEKVFVISSILGAFLFFLSPMVFGIISHLKGSNEKIQLPLSPWYPFAIDSIYLYLIVFSVESVISLMVVIYHISWQGCLFSSILCLQGEMKILALAFTDILDTARTMALRAPNRGNFQCHINSCLKECIQHHQQIIKCISLLNGAFKIIILEYLQTCTFIFCLNAMRLALAPLSISVTTVTSLGEVLPVMLQLWLICWFGQLLTNEGDMVRQSCYNSPWLSQNTGYKTTLQVVMSRCNRPLSLSAGGLYTVDMRTYSQILQAAYSYLNFLLSTHDRSKMLPTTDTS